jgi:NAD/FAD-utilizing enzyme apparently involved in cell division
MLISDQLKIKCLLDVLYQNNERIAVYEQIEKEIDINTWLMSAYTEASLTKNEFKDIFNRELSGIRMTLHRLKTQYNENKSDYEKRRLQRQNMAIKMLLEEKFDINLSKVINNFLSKRNTKDEEKTTWVSAEEEVYALIKETASEGKSLYSLLAEEEMEYNKTETSKERKTEEEPNIVPTEKIEQTFKKKSNKKTKKR